MLVVPEGISEIPYRCFYGCDNISGLKLPSTLKSIGWGGLFCVGCEELELPDGLESVGEYALAYMKLKAVEFPNTVTEIGRYALCGMEELRDVKLPDGLVRVPDYLLAGSLIEEIALPESVEEIGVMSFESCVNLKRIDFPQGLRLIGGAAFIMCFSLESIALPASVEELKGSSFGECKNIKSIYCKAENPPVDHGAFDSHSRPASDIPVYVPVGALERYRSAPGWDYFTNFIETDDFSGITTPSAAYLTEARIYESGGKVVIENLSGRGYSVYTTDGRLVAKGVADSDRVELTLPRGLYLVKAGRTAAKVGV